MKKKLLAFLLAASIAFTITGCDGSSSEEASSTSSDLAATSEPSSVTTSESSVEEEEETRTYETKLYTVGEDLDAGSYLITCTEANYSLEVLVFTDESDYEMFQENSGLTVGDWTTAVEQYAWADAYVYPDEQFYIGLSAGNIVMLSDGEGDLQSVDLNTTGMLYTGLYIVGEDLAAGDYTVTCTYNDLEVVIFAAEENYRAYHTADRTSSGDEYDAKEQNSVDMSFAGEGEVLSFSATDGMILIVNYGTGEFIDANEDKAENQSEESEDAGSEELVDGMRPEIKQAIDDYEAFFDEYCEFMITYSESDDTMSMLTDYATFMAQYATTMSSLEAMEDEDLNDAELLYYTEAVARITQELAELAVTISE